MWKRSVTVKETYVSKNELKTKQTKTKKYNRIYKQNLIEKVQLHAILNSASKNS